MNKFFQSKLNIACCLALTVAVSSCTKVEKDDNFPVGDPPPVVGGFVNSNEIAASNLVAHFPFENSIADAKGGVTGGTTSGTTSFVEGRKGQAYQGSMDGFIAYSNPGPVASLTSFTVSMWINTAKHDGGAQAVYTLAKQDGSFWGNFFLMIEGNNSPENRMFMKLHMEKNNAPFVEHWIEPFGNFRPDDMYNAWRHVAFSYDEATSKVGFYINGQRRELPPNMDTRVANSAGTPLGALNFKNATKFVIGSFQNDLGAPFNSPEPWMLNYTGKLDEFRIYNKALTDVEVSAIQILERQGR